jgi:hypothetical protein
VGKIGRVWGSLAWRSVEHRLARLFAMDAGLAREMLAGARATSDGRLGLRCAAFLVATSRPWRYLLPRRIRERAIRGFVWWLFVWQDWEPRMGLAYAGGTRALSTTRRSGVRQS